jgi:hypothetical protein
MLGTALAPGQAYRFFLGWGYAIASLKMKS